MKQAIAYALIVIGNTLLALFLVLFIVGEIVLVGLFLVALVVALGWWSLPFILLLLGVECMALGVLLNNL